MLETLPPTFKMHVFNHTRNILHIFRTRPLLVKNGSPLACFYPFVVVCSATFKLYGASLGFGSPNLNINYSVMILTPKPPSNNTNDVNERA
jgi:hypothetical protein